MEILKSIHESNTPKYRQIITSIESSIVNGVLKKGDKLPSLNMIKDKHSLSRDTVLMAFNDLKNRGIIHSVVGKGYYVSTEDVLVKRKVFLLFDELNSFKEDLYNSFLQNLTNNVQVDIFFHHFNIAVFKKLISDNIGNYSSYVIMPANLKDVKSTIENLSSDKVYLLDQINDALKKYPAIFQNFEKDTFNGLSSGLNKLVNYKKIVLLFSKEKQPLGILRGFELFCKTNSLNYEIIDTLEKRTPKKGEVYIVLDDENLIRIIKKIKKVQFVLTKDIGIISFNDTILKEVVENGITTISTDFKLMGKRLAEMILTNEQLKIENPSKLILRNSL